MLADLSVYQKWRTKYKSTFVPDITATNFQTCLSHKEEKDYLAFLYKEFPLREFKSTLESDQS